MLAAGGPVHASEPADSLDPRVHAARAALVDSATARARRHGMPVAQRAVLRELVLEACRHVLDEEMRPEEIADQTGATYATVESTLARARRWQLLDLAALGAHDPLGVAEAMDLPWVRPLSDADRIVLRRFLAPAIPPRHLASVAPDGATRARLAPWLVAHRHVLAPRTTREAWAARLLTRAECEAWPTARTASAAAMRAACTGAESLDTAALRAHARQRPHP